MTGDEERMTPAGRRWVTGIMEFWDDDRPVEEVRRLQEERICCDGIETSASQFRVEMIAGLELRPREWGPPVGAPDKNVIMLGCHPLMGGIQEIIAFTRVLQRLGETYTFLARENCCAGWVPLVNLHRGDRSGREAALERSRELIGQNIAEARRLGAKAMYYVCPGCAYVVRRFYKDCDIPQLYYADLIVDVMTERQPRLTLEAEFAYYPGCQAKAAALGGPNCDWDWKPYKHLLQQVEGLRLKDVARYCCATDWKRIVGAIEKKQVEATVMPCWACSGMFNNLKPDLPRRGLAEVLLAALQA